MLRCPKCKSDNVSKTSRRKYMLRATLLFLVMIASYVVLVYLSEEELTPMVLAGLAASGIAAIVSAIKVIILLGRAIRTKQTTYYCNFCDKAVDMPLSVDDPKAFDTLQQIRRQ